MKCPNCQRENSPAGRFCIYCGAVLPAVENQAKSGQDPPSEQASSLQEEVRRLSALVTLMNNRLAAVERAQGISATSGQPVPTPPPQGQAAAPTVERWESPVAQAPPSRPASPKPAETKEREWEQILGGNWLARIGAIALVIGVGFFLKFAFDNNWIGPTGRIILGIIVGLLLLGGGYLWRKRYPIFSQAISGAGIAILYLSVYAGFAIYHLMNFYAALAFLFLVSVASAALALLYNSMSLAIIGIIG
ncbi:MAG TPA: DUF2339 domain-containing protein, partial [Dehalococcoidales bacterium]|nr:DUF2339 domain-containing protein [Dehalococcoidales bacterium]